jgi:hypothetical protein
MEHTSSGGEALAPLLLGESIFMQRCREVLMQDEPEPSFASNEDEDKDREELLQAPSLLKYLVHERVVLVWHDSVYRYDACENSFETCSWST